MKGKRQLLMRQLDVEICQTICKDKYAELTYIDIIQVLSEGISSYFRWYRKRRSYRKLEGEK